MRRNKWGNYGRNELQNKHFEMEKQCFKMCLFCFFNGIEDNV
jgi:hypothetical protein